MATNDWKAELKRRIEDIKEKKKAETDVQRRVRSYQNSAAAATAPALEPVMPIETEAEELPPVPPQPLPAAPPRRRRPAPQAATTQPIDPPPAITGGDPLFEVAGEEDATEAATPEARSEASIIAELNRISAGGKQTSRRESSRRTPVPDLSEESLPTLFAIEESEPNPVKERVIAAARAAAANLDEETVEEPTPVRNSRAEAEIPHRMSMEMDEEDETAFVLDDDLDRYMPLETDPATEAAAPESPVVKRAPAGELVIDRTQRHANNMRLGAGALDTLVLSLIEAFIIWMSSMLVESNFLELLLSSPMAWGAFFIVLHFIYYVLFTSTTGQTPGKRLMGLRVEAKEGGLIGVLPGIARWILLAVSLVPAALGLLLMYTNKDGRALHDLILGMQVKRMHG